MNTVAMQQPLDTEYQFKGKPVSTGHWEQFHVIHNFVHGVIYNLGKVAVFLCLSRTPEVR